MHLIPTLATLLCLSFLSYATDLSDERVIRIPLQRRSFTLSNDGASAIDKEFFKSQLSNLATKYRSTLAAYEVNTGSSHPLADAISAINTGTWAPIQNAGTVGTATSYRKLQRRRRPTDLHKRGVSLSEVNGNMWMGSISVGTPPMNFSVLFDTGSADLILPNQTCGTSCNGHNRYDPTTSSTSINLNNETFELMYGGGSSVSGEQYTDNVCVGGYEAKAQTLGAATTYSAGLEYPTFIPDGLLGMGFSQISALGALPVFQTMVSNHVVNQGVFGITLSSQSGKSELTIGGTNTNSYQESSVEYIPLSLPGYWQIRFARLTRPGLNNTPDVVVVNKTSYAEAIIDSGTTLIVASDSCAEAFYADVPGAKLSPEIGGGAWSVPCDLIDSIAPTLTFGNRNFTIPPSIFNLGPVSNNSSDCLAGVAGGGSPYWIIGDVFLQSVYSIFDVNNSQVGFANLA